MGAVVKITPLERFFSHVRFTDTCWIWTAYLDKNGYGEFSRSRSDNVKAYRWLYEQVVGPVPTGLELDHLCRVRVCVNPDHLEPVTHAENLRRSPISPTSINARKTHCIRGHEFAGTNLLIDQGKRRCRICRNATSRITSAKYMAKKRAAHG